MKKPFLTTILLATSLFANSQFLDKKPLFSCNQDLTIMGVDMQKRGQMISIDEIKDLNVNYFLEQSNHRFDALSFLKDGFFYDGKLYQFNHEFGNKFFNYLENAKLTMVVCKTPNISVFGNTKIFSNQNKYEVVKLDDKYQLLIGNYLLKVAQYQILEEANGGILIGTDPKFFVESLLEEKNIIESTNNLKNEITRLEKEIEAQLLKDKKNKEKAVAKNENYVIYADALRFQEYLKLKGENNENK